MFRDKSFNIAFLVSAAWHLFIMFAVTIVVLPANFQLAKTSTVSFLGPLLEKTAFEIMVEEGIRSKKTIYDRSMPLDDSFSLSHSNKGLYLKFRDLLLTEKTGALEAAGKGLIDDSKIAPPFRPLISEKKGEAFKKEERDFFIEGPLAGREILFKPGLPAVSKRIERGRESSVVRLRFEVRPDGMVGEVGLLASSGYPDVDMAAINYIRGIRFSPILPARKDASVWGKAVLNLKAR